MEVEQREYLRNRIAILTMTHLLKGTPHPWAYDAAAMTPKGRADVVKWLTKQAVLLDQHHDQLSKRYTARYLYKA